MAERRCVVIGGGAEAAVKIGQLQAGGARRIDVVAPELHPAVAQLVDGTSVRHIAQNYAADQLDDAFLAITTDIDKELNRRVARDAARRRVLLNAMDDPPHCDFYAGSVIRRGSLTVAISTGGICPALAVRLRRRLEGDLGAELGAFLALGEKLRPLIMERIGQFNHRRAAWYRIVDEVLPALRAGQDDAAWTEALAIVDQWAEKSASA